MASFPINDFFPHENVRKVQDKMVEDIEYALMNERILLAHAPTGLGKTASALSVALWYALEKKKKIFFLTNRHTQHHIAVETLQKIRNKNGKQFSCVDLIGKRWMCSQEIAGLFGVDFTEFCRSVVEKGECEFYTHTRDKKGPSVAAQAFVSELKQMGPLHNEDIISLSKEQKMCSYEIALALAKDASIIIGDYNYLFNPFVQAALFKKMDIALEDVIVIVDEAHNLPSRVTDMLSTNLSSYVLKNAVYEAKKFGYNGVILWLQELMGILTGMSDWEDGTKEKKVTKDFFVTQVKKITNYEDIISELETAAEEIRKKQRKSYIGGIANFLLQWLGEDKGFLRFISERTTKYGPNLVLSYTCLDPALLTKDIFASVHSGVLMSGTLTPVFMYSDVLGISHGIEKEYPSPFPLENKVSLIVPQTSTKYTLRTDKMYKQIAETCITVSNIIPGNVALFFPSYHLRDKIGFFIESGKKLFWEKSDMSKEEKSVLLNDFRCEKEKGGILLGVTGANFAEGVDLPGDLLNGVIVIGLPLAKPDLKTREVIQYYEDKFKKGWDYGYTFPALNKCFQSAGRCIRSETDKGAVIYLDERFAWKRYYDHFSREGLIVSVEYEKILKEFFN
ncbi:ATP-dependent DNA helicase [Candidatus Woesearchaeota archaeon]|jgi:DNA excision repair protein ERCC-2|nr:ATP-dependent DNA helicase [Candidatus Woesearchaeota archaeon]MBT5396684.1 ATP-dependent DNA helicase [Candidatus Woesearchaeota archaeon]MBT5924371.1 ATP-dependent DNA helicase [Candidatus Woesearchaeota archaeon]MBT6367529.1 ATP-dependent DNA helicase [Candidatus Woesearchaeota archaeon]MBT7763028.1 ATP-dependent DNA helicase [Candidatus Woesearchaeota archaeon]